MLGVGDGGGQLGTELLFSQKLLRNGIFTKSIGNRNRGGIGLSYRQHRLAEFIPWNQFRAP